MTKRRVFVVFEWLGRHEFIVLLAVLIVVAGLGVHRSGRRGARRQDAIFG